jgi:hypothetical protein
VRVVAKTMDALLWRLVRSLAAVELHTLELELAERASVGSVG